MEDQISSGQYTLTINEDGEADILALDTTGVIESARFQGANISISLAGDRGTNWIAIYSDGTIEITA